MPGLTTHAPAFQHALSFLSHGLKNNRWKDGEPLPSIRILSQLADVSRGTMGSALNHLKKADKLSVKPGGRIIAGHYKKPSIPLHESEKGIQQEKRALFEQDIIKGIYSRHAKLPSYKELQARYGVCFRSMRKIIKACVADGVLVPHLRGYIQTGFSRSRLRSSLVFVTQRGFVVSGQTIDDRSFRIFELLENECARLNLNLRRMEVDFYSPDYRNDIDLHFKKDETILGFIFDLWWGLIEEWQEHVIGFLGSITAQRKPIVVLDQNGNFPLPVSVQTNRLFQVLKLSGIGAGKMVARMLLNLGHTQVAYISPYHNSDWSVQRLAGICLCYEKADLKNGVLPVVSNLKHILHTHVLALSDIPEDLMFKILSYGRTEEQTQLLFNAYKELKADDELMRRPSKTIEKIRKNINFVEKLATDSLDPEYVQILSTMLFGIAESQVAPHLLEPLFASIIKNPGVTAWICSNDGIALAARSYLREKNIEVPGRISIIGFDNSLSAKQNRITSFDFNAQSFIHQAISFIASPTRANQHLRRIVEVEGFVVARDTTAPARKPGA